jgi:hypothetical protein
MKPALTLAALAIVMPGLSGCVSARFPQTSVPPQNAGVRSTAMSNTPPIELNEFVARLVNRQISVLVDETIAQWRDTTGKSDADGYDFTIWLAETIAASCKEKAEMVRVLLKP